MSTVDHSPEGPDGLDIVAFLEAGHEDHPGFRHWFWNWLAERDNTLDDLRLFAELYYPHVQRFRQYLAGAITVAPGEELQTALTEIMADEYGIHLAGRAAEESHPAMFRGFMSSLGLTAGQWESFQPIEGVTRFRAMHFALFSDATCAEAVGAVVFGMENSTPHRHSHVVQAIREYNSRTGEEIDDTFFAAHVEIDEHHANLLFRTAMPLLESDPEGVARGVRWSFDARKVMLDDIARRMGAQGGAR